MFRGFSNHTIDAKGRVIIPARFREALKAGGGEDRIIVSRMDLCVFAYGFDRWREIETKIMEMAEKSDNIRRFRRLFIGGAFECNCDKQDRILIPPTLREYAGIEKEIVLVGALDHFEIWDRKRYASESDSWEGDVLTEGVRNEIAKVGL